ncbi:MAG TPA: hypothetical protein VFL55_14500 [Acetobacteraceae bacterium]|nr:hypothetical protein [Acetobacteraceae bacterium]
MTSRTLLDSTGLFQDADPSAQAHEEQGSANSGRGPQHAGQQPVRADDILRAADFDGRGHAHGIQIEEPDAVVDGKTIAEWTEDWWRWALQAPSDYSSLTSPLPRATHLNNDGKIFFIAGGPNATITVPANTPILFPMINLFDTEGPGIQEEIPGFVERGGSFADMANEVADLFQNNIVDAHAKIMKDGKTLLDVHSPESAKFAEESGTFAIGTPNRGSVLANLVPSPLDPSIANLPFTSSSGDWLMLGRLAPGRYTLEFGGTSNALSDPQTAKPFLGSFTTETTDTLIVGHP